MRSNRLPAWALWVFIVRGTFALALGVALLFSGAGLSRLGTYVAVYWLLAALLTLRWASRQDAVSGRRVGAAAGAIGLATGLMVLLREPLSGLIDESLLMNLLGLSAIATGMLRLFGRFHDDQLEGARPRRSYRIVVGTLELVLGTALLMADEGSASTIRLSLGVWGLLTGTFLILDGLWLRRLQHADAKRSA
jgi:uncharacterized membrane protein HdeD (DUF308 family)